MPTLDLSFTITAIIAICALVSPILTAIINNIFQLLLRRQEFKHEEKLADEEHEREVFEGYVRAAGACIQVQNTEALHEFGRHSSQAMYYVPEDIREEMLKLEKSIRTDDKSSKVELLYTITTKLRQLRHKQ